VEISIHPEVPSKPAVTFVIANSVIGGSLT